MNLTIEVSSGDFIKSLKIPTSKSYANRLLILASIFPSEITIEGLPKATDVLTLINCLKKIGLEITEDRGGLTIFNCFPQCEVTGREIILETGDGGTTNRFLIALLARGKNTYILKPDLVFLNRPIEGFLKELSSFGVFVEKGADFIKIRGSINLNRELQVDSSMSTQFSSALALSLANTDVRVISKNIKSSKNYLELTNYLIKKFKDGYKNFRVPLDFSSLSYPLALAALNGSVLIENYQGRDNYQGDSIFLDLLKEAGVIVCESSDSLFVEKSSNLKPLKIDCSGCLDLVPTLSFFFSHIPGITLLKNIKALCYKESDRIFEIQRLLGLFKKKCRITENFDLEISGSDQKCPFVEYEGPKDHRMIMTAYLFMRLNSGGLIKNPIFVDKSFPDFFKTLS